MKKVLIIKTSLHVNSNSDLLADYFADGATKAGNNVEVISLKKKDIKYCMGCFACQKLGKCVIKDDANEIADKICESDVIVWVTPIYYYSVSGQMKTLIDRCNSLYSRAYKFKDVYLLATATENEEYTKDGAMKVVQGWVDCFNDVKFKETLFVGDVTDPNDIRDNEGLNKAYELGNNIR